MKKVWVKSIPWRKEIVQAAVESGADALWVPSGMKEEVKKFGLIPIVSEDGDIKIGYDVIEMEVKDKKDEEEVISISSSKKVVVKNENWKIIPLENLLSRRDNIFIEINNLPEGETAFGILEKGVEGVIVNHSEPDTVKRIVRELKKQIGKIDLTTAYVRRVEPLGTGDRVCVDICSVMASGEGMLVGNSSRALFLIHSENLDNPFVNPRPFRVNAGPVHAYIRMADGNTKYLSEVRAGDKALVVNFEGKSSAAVVGRAKIERRPLALIEAEESGEAISTILQNAETIRLTQPDGKAVSIVDLKEGSEILVYREKKGRHFGVQIDETIIEK